MALAHFAIQSPRSCPTLTARSCPHPDRAHPLCSRAHPLCSGAIFVIDDNTDAEAVATKELMFVIDTPGGKKEIRMPLSKKSMAGAAILDNELINIPDCYKDERFDPAMDQKTGFRTIQMLCVPVAASTGEVIGAIQVINTWNGMSFTDADVELLRVFRVYVQIAIMNNKGMEC